MANHPPLSDAEVAEAHELIRATLTPSAMSFLTSERDALAMAIARRLTNARRVREAAGRVLGQALVASGPTKQTMTVSRKLLTDLAAALAERREGGRDDG